MSEYNRRRKQSIPKPLKDYGVAIIAWLLFLIIIYSFFSSPNKKENVQPQELTKQKVVDSIILNFDSDKTKAVIEYPNWDKKDAVNNSELYKWEKLLVKDWSVNFSLNWNDFSLDKLWILKYKKDWNLFLESSNLWVKANNDITVYEKFAEVNIKKWSVVNLTQNEVESLVYVLKWKVEVSNLAWASTILSKGQKIWIMAMQSNDKDADLTSLKWDFDDYFKMSDWYVKNNWDFYLKMNDDSEDKENKEKTDSWVVNSNVVDNNTNSYISFDNLNDESYVNSSKIDITWKILNDNVWKILLWNIEAKINNKNFTFKNIILDNKTNDLVFKIFDKDSNLLKKFVYTVYNNSWNKNKTNSAFKVTNFPVDASKFKFTSPSTTWTYVTYSKFVTIRWMVPKWLVEKVTVDSYPLKSFNWVTWRYHASTDYNNLKVWTNQYEIKYYDKNGKLIFKNYFTIILKSKKLDNKKYSQEAKIN